LAFHNWNLRRSADGGVFIGLENFLRLTEDAVFWQSFGNTLFYVVVAVTLEFLAGLCLALVLHGHFRGVSVIRSIIMIPLFIVPVVVALIWRIIYNQEFGPLYYALRTLGLVNPQDAFGLANPAWSMLFIIAASVWQVTPFVFLV